MPEKSILDRLKPEPNPRFEIDDRHEEIRKKAEEKMASMVRVRIPPIPLPPGPIKELDQLQRDVAELQVAIIQLQTLASMR
jgi:hypothetical protein